jgi:hypothetical protein
MNIAVAHSTSASFKQRKYDSHCLLSKKCLGVQFASTCIFFGLLFDAEDGVNPHLRNIGLSWEGTASQYSHNALCTMQENIKL